MTSQVPSYTLFKTKINELSANIATKQMGLSSVAVTISSTSWTDNSVTKSVTGVTSTSLIWVAPDPDYSDAYGDAGIKATAQGAGTITFTCDTTPTESIVVNVVIG